MATLNKRIETIERAQRAELDFEPFDTIKENGLAKGLEILEDMGKHADADAIRKLAQDARTRAIEWRSATYTNNR